jgi:hypothetical protein
MEMVVLTLLLADLSLLRLQSTQVLIKLFVLGLLLL